MRERERENEREREETKSRDKRGPIDSQRNASSFSRVSAVFSLVEKIPFFSFRCNWKKFVSFPKPRAERCKPYKAVLIVAIMLPVEWNSNSISQQLFFFITHFLFIFIAFPNINVKRFPPKEEEERFDRDRFFKKKNPLFSLLDVSFLLI